MAATCCWKLKFFHLLPTEFHGLSLIFFFHLYGISVPFHTAISFICKTPWLCYRPRSQDITSQVREGLQGFSLKTHSVGPQSPAYFHACQLCCGSCDPWWAPASSESHLAQKPGLWHCACGELRGSGRQGQIQLPSPFHQACLLVQLGL